MKKTITVLTLCVMLFALCASVLAQQTRKVYRVGYLVPGASVDASPAIEAFRRGLQALGYVEGQNIVVELRFSKGDAGQFPEFAAELVRLKVYCIVTLGLPAIRSAKQPTSTIPIVMNVADDPVQMGLIAESCLAWGKYYWVHQHWLRANRQTSGATEGSVSEGQPDRPSLGW